MPIVCPCCGGAINTGKAPLESLPEMNVAEQKRRIVAALVRAFPRAVDVKDLVEALYWDNPSCGPDGAERVLRVHVSGLRRDLKRYGWTIPNNTNGMGNYGRYRLAPLEGAGV
jgi:DNA-binding response OmpR family regulator